MPSGVIFDMDGVLVDSGPAHQESWRVLAKRRGKQVSAETFARTFGMPSRDIIRILWGAQLGDDEIRALDDEKEAAYREMITGNVPLMPGCREALAALRDAGLRLAVATSGPPANLALVLREGGLASFFQATVHGFDIQHGKPAPDCFLLAAERLGVCPSACVVVEDAPVGVEAAIAAGMPVIGLTGTHPAAALSQAGAVQVVSQLSALTPDFVAALRTHE